MDRTEPTPQPAKSAKDAINAMYATGAAKTGLSDYLASSAKEIINAAPSTKKRDQKSASSLHRHDSGHRESTRPSASALMRQAAPKPPLKPKPIASSVDPLASKAEVAAQRSAAQRAKARTTGSSSASVVRTSLKLGPKKPPMISKAPAVSRNSARRPAGDTLRAKKQSLAIKPVPRPVHTDNPRVFQDIVRPHTQVSQPQSATRPASNTTKARLAPATPKTHRPLDSIKNRFRPAPKGYATNDPRRQRPYKAEDFLNPSHSMPEDTPSTEQPDRATHIYGMIEAPREYSDLPRWAKTANNLDAASAAVQASSDGTGLGVIEDYGDPIAHKSDQLDHPDNNRYALSSQSPFFLQTVEVDKRPLSGGPSIREQVETPLSASQNLTERPKKNRYEKKTKPAKKPKATAEPVSQPSSRDDLTVIIPSAHRSHIPLFLLLLITILLGAAVGALAYLFFFQ